MSSTLSVSEPELAALVALDWGDSEHVHFQIQKARRLSTNERTRPLGRLGL